MGGEACGNECKRSDPQAQTHVSHFRTSDRRRQDVRPQPDRKMMRRKDFWPLWKKKKQVCVCDKATYACAVWLSESVFCSVCGFWRWLMSREHFVN